MNNSLLGGHMCTDNVDVRQDGNTQIGRNRLATIPQFNFICNGSITSIRARVRFDNGSNFPFFQVWRLSYLALQLITKLVKSIR